MESIMFLNWSQILMVSETIGFLKALDTLAGSCEQITEESEPLDEQSFMCSQGGQSGPDC